MKKLSLILLGGAISLALVAGVFAQSTDTTTAKPTTKTKTTKTVTTKTTTETKETVKKHQFTGTVTGVDATANTITVEKKNGKKTETMTFAAGEKVKLADIKKDSKVVVTYTKEGDKATASSVKESSTKKTTTKKSETKSEKKTEEKPAESTK